MQQILHIQSITKQELREIISQELSEQLSTFRKDESEKFLEVKPAAKLLRCSPQTIWNRIKKGDIIAKRHGHKYLISREEIDRILKDVKSLKYRRDV